MVFFSSWWYNWWYGTQKLGTLNAYATALPKTGPYDSVQLGMLKKLDQMVSDLELASGIQVHLTMVLRERAMVALPEDTAALLKGNLMSSEIALELVRRDMTEYSQLSSGLYGTSPEDLEDDPALKRVHDRLSMAVELHGVLTLAGITPAEREWAQALADNFVDLRSLRATPWSEVAWLLGLVELTPEKKVETANANAEQNVFDNPPTSTELRIVKELYSVGDGAPAIRAQVLSYRMSLDVADELENMGIYDASQITATDQRSLLLRAQEKVEAEEREAEELAAERLAASQQACREADEAARKAREEAATAAADAKAKKAAEEEEARKAAELAAADQEAADAAKKAAKAEAEAAGQTTRGISVLPTPAPPAEPRSTVPAADAGGAEGSSQDRSRALPLLAIAAKALPIAAKVLPKLGTATKLTSVTRSGSSGLATLGRNMSAMKANAKITGSSAAKGARGAASGLFYPKPQATSSVGGKLDEFSSTVDSATGAVQSLKGLYNELTPDVEAQVAAIEQEKARLNKSIDYVREELGKVDVTGVVGSNLTAAEAALDRAKAQVAPDPNFGARIAQGSSQALQQSLVDQRLDFGGAVGLGSYGSNEELVAKASGGVAMYGMNFFPTSTEIVLKPYAPLLQNPSFIEMTGAVSPFEAKVEKTTSQTTASAFHNTSSNAGISVAETISKTKGSSFSASVGIFASASASGSTAKATNESSQTSTSTEKNSTSATESTTTSATIIEYIRCPMRSFRIPVSQMDLNAGAFEAVIAVDSMEKGESFLDNYGSHVSTGRQELGGIFFSTISVTSETSMSKVSMMSAASKKSEDIRSKSVNTEGGAGGSFLGVGGKASTRFGTATSVGEVKVTRKANAKEEAEEVETAQFENYIRSIGPSTPTPESFAEALFTDTSTWAITDRGRLEAMVPVTVVLEKALRQLRAASSGEDQDPVVKNLEMAILFVRAAWRRRAKLWGYLLNDTPDLNVPTPVINLLKSAFPSSLGRVPTLLKALLGSLIIKHTQEVRNESKEDLVDLVRPDVMTVAKVIFAASKKAEEKNNSFPVELPFLDAAGVERQVNANMNRLMIANTGHFAALTLAYDTIKDRFTLSDKAREILWDASPEKKKRDAASATAAAGTQATDLLNEEAEEKKAFVETAEDRLAKDVRTAWEAEVDPATGAGDWGALDEAEKEAFIADKGPDATLSDETLGELWDALAVEGRRKWSEIPQGDEARTRFALERNAAHVEELWREEAARVRWERERNPFVATESGLRALWTSYSKSSGGKASWADLDVWQQKRIAQDKEQGGRWRAEDYQLFQGRYFKEDQSYDFVKALGDGLNAADPGPDGGTRSSSPYTTKYITARLSSSSDDSDERATALQRGVSGMLKADWLVLRDLWVEDERNPELPNDDELGPEGYSLLSRIIKGIPSFDKMETAKVALERAKEDLEPLTEATADTTVSKDDGLNKAEELVKAAEELVKAAEAAYKADFPDE